jgi:hypothetical protein
MADPIHTHRDSIDVAAPPEAVYRLVTAMERYGEWSSENAGGYWRKDSSGQVGTGEVGDMFVGINRAGDREWKAPVKIVEREPNRTFAFVTGGREHDIALWKYTLEPSATGTRLIEDYELRNLPQMLQEGGQPAIDAAWKPCAPASGPRSRA